LRSRISLLEKEILARSNKITSLLVRASTKLDNTKEEIIEETMECIIARIMRII
jgi:hypothetical protein